MAKTYVATQQDLDATNTQVTNLQSAVQDPTGGIDARLTVAEGDISNIENSIGATDATGLRKRINDNETSIGDSNSGLTKQVADLESTVGTDNTQGLQKRTVDLENTVNTASTGLVDKVTALEDLTDGLAYNSTSSRYSQSTAPTATASADTDVLTKADGDSLYAAASAVSTSSAGGYNSDTESDTWNEICKVGGISIDARYPTSGSVVARIVNSTGGTFVSIFETNDEGSLVNNSINIGGGNSLQLNKSSTVSTGIKSFRAGIYTSPGVNSEAYTVEVYMRNTSAGIRIACSIVGKF